MMLTQPSQVHKCLLKSKTRVYIQRKTAWSDQRSGSRIRGGEASNWRTGSRIKRGGALQVKKLQNILAPRALCLNEWKYQVWYTETWSNFKQRNGTHHFLNLWRKGSFVPLSFIPPVTSPTLAFYSQARSLQLAVQPLRSNSIDR